MQVSRRNALARSSSVVLLLSALMHGPCAAQIEQSQSLTIQPQLEQAFRCPGEPDLLRIIVSYTIINSGTFRLIVPRITKNAGYNLRYASGKRKSVTFGVHSMDGIDPKLWRTATPDPQYFEVIEPGRQVRRGPEQIFLDVKRRPNDKPIALTPSINLGQVNAGQARVAKVLWAATGLLQAGVHEASNEVRIVHEGGPDLSYCRAVSVRRR